MRSKKYHVYLTEEEKRLVIKALIDERNALLATGHYTDAIDDLLVQITRTKPKNMLVVAV
ncbi:MAG: hypothetical protein IJI83_03330 [Oscillospiraceae bacterium]|nr:hypothetical protein [Oscillospiraceae bacterium]